MSDATDNRFYREKPEQVPSKDLDFGDYCHIEQRRFGAPNEMYLHKVIGRLRSNSWVDVPVPAVPEEIVHPEMEDVVACICCGVSERLVLRFRATDCLPVARPAHEPSERHPMLSVLAICTAYESGYGLGLVERPKGNYGNPYDPVNSPHESRAWAHGYDEGTKKRTAQPPSDVRLAIEELKNFINAQRFNRDHFRNDTEFAEWCLSRARYTLGLIEASATKASPTQTAGSPYPNATQRAGSPYSASTKGEG